jgi:hypothetical protein
LIFNMYQTHVKDIFEKNMMKFKNKNSYK